MSVARPSQCVFCIFRRSTRIPLSARRTLHCTSLRQRPRRRDNQEGEGIDINVPKEGQRALKTPISQYKQLPYTPEQLEAIRLAQEVIPKDAFDPGKNPDRNDPWAVDYYDSFETVDPVFDKPVLHPWENIDETSRLLDDDNIEEAAMNGSLFTDASIEAIENSPEDMSENDAWVMMQRHMRLTTGTEASELRSRSALQPSLPPPKKEQSTLQEQSQSKGGSQPGKQEGEVSPALLRLIQMTGYSREYIAGLRVKSLVQHQVVNQTRLGKISKTYYLSVAGNGDGLLGIGEGKSEESGEARLQSQYRAIRNMVPILRYENRTILGNITAKVSATELELMTRPPGFGLRCSQYIWEMCKCAGIHDLAARVTRARNPMNTVKAAFDALVKQKDPDDVARARGKKLVDVRKVYYAGQV